MVDSDHANGRVDAKQLQVRPPEARGPSPWRSMKPSVFVHTLAHAPDRKQGQAS